MLAKFLEFVKGPAGWIKAHADTLLLVAIAMLFVLLAFAAGYTIATWQSRAPIIITNPS